MLQGASSAGLPDSDKVKGMIFSVWVLVEAGGNYLGSTVGSLAYDSTGFEWAAGLEAVVIMVSVMVMVVCSLAWWGVVKEKEE